MGEVVLRQLAAAAGLSEKLEVTSRGIMGWHEGKPADPRTVDALRTRGFEGSEHRAARLTDADIAENDMLVAMAREHRDAMIERGADPAQVVLFTDFDPASPADPDVFDPYYDGEAAFAAVLHQVERTAEVLLERVRPTLDA